MVNIPNALQKVKDDHKQIIPTTTVLAVAAAVGHTFRQRTLGPVQTFRLFFIQVLNGNVACSALRHLAGMTCTVGAYCQARSRLPLALLRGLLEGTCQAMRDATQAGSLWFGHRLFHLDGSENMGKHGDATHVLLVDGGLLAWQDYVMPRMARVVMFPMFP